MRLLILRSRIKETVAYYQGQVAKNDDYYQDVSTCTSAYMHLASALLSHFGEVTVAFQFDKDHPRSKFRHSTGLVERFARLKFADLNPPQVLFVRGPFKEYQRFVRACDEKSFKIYYPAGEKFTPPKEFGHFDLVFADDERHLGSLKRKGFRAALFKKPAAPCFVPKGLDKQWDVCFIANGSQVRHKGWGTFRRLVEACPDLKFVNVGLKNEKIIKQFRELPNVFWAGWHRREQIPEFMNQSKVGLVLSNKKDGSPRVIQEYIACGTPIVVRSKTACSGLYINRATGFRASNFDEIIHMARNLVNNWRGLLPEVYYQANLTPEKCAEWIASKILCGL